MLILLWFYHYSFTNASLKYNYTFRPIQFRRLYTFRSFLSLDQYKIISCIYRLKDSHHVQHDLYVNNLVGDVKANPRDFYRYINSQKKDNQDIPPLKRRGRTGITASEIEQVEEFNEETDVFSKSDHSEVQFLSRSAPFMDDIIVSNEGVTKLLKGLNPSKALGPDELHPRGLKELAAELGPVFAHLFQKSLDTAEIPKEWSLANICPLYKKW